MNCVVCQKPDTKRGEPSYTCSPSCAGKLAHSQKLANQLRRQFNNETKNSIREYLIKHYIEPSPICEKPMKTCFRILDFWGGGLFADAVIDHNADVNNQSSLELTTIDNDKKLYPALRAYERKKNHSSIVNNQISHVSSFCGSLAKYIHGKSVKNHTTFDFIWLDYCGSVKQAQDDLPLLRKIADEKTLIAITAFCSRDGMISKKGRNMVLDGWVRDSFPLHRKQKVFEYNGMGVFIYKVPGSVFRKLSYLFK